MGSSARVIRSGPRSRRDRGGPTYSALASRPWHILVYLAPFMVAYEVGAVLYLTSSGMVQTIAAHNMVVRLFGSLGGVVWHAPTILLAAVLLVWHLLLKDSWRVRPGVLLGMAFESCLWTLPVLVLGLLENALISMNHPSAALAAPNLHDQPWQARATLSIGAGLYEELLFRLVLLTILHFVFVDVMKIRHKWGTVLAVVGTGVLFALYHPNTGEHPLIPFVFLSIVGTYFGTLFLLRGFGVVVAVHAIYDAVVLIALGGGTAP